MKSMHFCTKGRLKDIATKKEFDSIRTGWFPEIFEDDIINITRFVKDGKDEFICKAKCILVYTIQYWEILRSPDDLEESKRYNRKFNDKHLFVKFVFKKTNTKTLEDYSNKPTE